MGTGAIPGGATSFCEATDGVDAPIGRHTLLDGRIPSIWRGRDLTGVISQNAVSRGGMA